MDFLMKRYQQANANWLSEPARDAAKSWHDISRTIDYQYMFDWCGLPIIQDPQDVCMVHEVLWRFRPSIVIETGIARGGSLLLSASVLAALGYMDSLAEVPVVRRVIGVDIDIRPHNRVAIEQHLLAPLVTLIEGSSTDESVVNQVKALIPRDARVAVILDSHHTSEHVFKELNWYAPLVTEGGPIIVMDTGIEFAAPSTFSTEREWGPGNSPYTAVQDFLPSPLGEAFTVDRSMEMRHLITAAPGGLLWRDERT